MKRILPLILTVLLLPALLAVPAMADEVSESGRYNLLDYYTANDSGSNYLTVRPGEDVYFRTVETGTIFYVDALVRILNATKPTEAYVQIGSSTYTMEMISLGDGYYKLCASTSTSSGYVRFSFNSTAVIQFMSVEVSTINSIYRQLGGSWMVLTDGGDSYTCQYPANPRFFFTQVGVAYENRRFSSYLQITGNVKAYDYVEVVMAVMVEDIESIAVDDGISPLPFTINPIYQATAEDPVQPNTLISLRIDVRGLEEAYVPHIRITGYCTTSANNFSISSIYGVLMIEDPNPLLFWFSELKDWLSSGFNSVVDALGGSNDPSGVQDNISSAIGDLENVQSVMDGVTRPSLDSINFDISSMMDNAAVATYGNIFSTLTGNQYMTNILLIAFILAAASFLLFGRR